MFRLVAVSGITRLATDCLNEISVRAGLADAGLSG
jgi:hypothetical protein